MTEENIPVTAAAEERRQETGRDIRRQEEAEEHKMGQEGAEGDTRRQPEPEGDR